MSNPAGTAVLPHGTELNAVYAIARIVAETYDTEAGLDAIFRLARTIFIFDVAALYIQNQDTEELEPVYARALGRGRSQESELAWGEPAASEAFRSGETVLRKEDRGPGVTGRERRRDYLGLPLMVGGRCVGGLVFGRFGGPPFPPEHIRLAEFVGWHVGQLLETRRLSTRIATLEAQRELARMQDEFIATISHELRTPLGFIKGYVTTLLREDASWDGGTRTEFLHIIDEEAERLRELIDNLLDSSRLETGALRMTLEPARITATVRDAATRVVSLVPEMRLTLDVPESLPVLSIDSARIAQVLDNLLSNAHKYAPGVPVTVRAEDQGDWVRVEVKDGGPGIPVEHQPHLFQRFYRVQMGNRSVRGTGLGLYICRKIIEAHSGEIGLESKPGEGACFYFRLPVPPASIEDELARRDNDERRQDHPGR